MADIKNLFFALIIFSLILPSSPVSAEGNSWELPMYDEYNQATGIAASDEIQIEAWQPAQSEDVRIDAVSEVIETTQTGYAEWSFTAPNTGKYTIIIEYKPLEGKGSDIERELSIDGQVPFNEVSTVIFSRIWKNAADIRRDANDNDLRPKQVESFSWRTATLSDSYGDRTEPFEFYITAGVHTLRLTSIKEPMALRSIRLSPLKVYRSYAETKDEYAKAGYRTASESVYFEAESALLKSGSTIYPLYDRASAGMSPYSASGIRLNMIGREKWQQPGQWIRYHIQVAESGLYKLALRYKQDTVSGGYVSRSLRIDGDYPFEEAKELRFNYSGNWEVSALGDSSGAYEFYLEAGEHDIELAVTLGEMAPVLKGVEQSVLNLNEIYREILMITGTVPDSFRDYNFEELIPETLKKIHSEYLYLSGVIQQVEGIVGHAGSQMSTVRKVALDLEIMDKNAAKIGAKLENFKANIGSLAAWNQESRNQPLELDWLELMPLSKELPKGEKGFFIQIYHNFAQFIQSFFTDYYIVNNADGEETLKKVDVWVGTGSIGGRDQAQILRQMVDDGFTPDSGINVDVQLVAPGTLLPATLAGTGPDIALQVGNSDPVNYAVRKAVVNLGKFSDFADVAERFNPNAIIPYQFGGGVYALPETYSYPMLFYRADILEDIGLLVPETWDDVYAMIPELKKRSMDFGLPTTFDMFTMLYYQNGGAIYADDGQFCRLSEKIGLKTFEQWTQFYTSNKISRSYDFVNRFRTGEIPIAIADFQAFNQLSVFAPEIKGRWRFALVPGTLQANGTIDHSVPGAGVATIMMNGTEDEDSAWAFMKWWTGTQAQVRFAQELESLMGPAARYAAANVSALEQIPWPASEYRTLKEQWNYVKAIPEVPGGYITPRYLDFAFKSVINAGEDPGEQLIRYVKQINKEINRKRKEFGLPLGS